MELIKKLEQIILENIADEKFGVGELAEQAGMSRSTLLRKLQKENGKSASEMIKEIRLQESKKFLNDQEMTISEISFKVGFNSTSYFIKCFKEEFGYSPGEYQKKLEEGEIEKEEEQSIEKTEKPVNSSEIQYKWIAYFLFFFIATALIWYFTKSPRNIEMNGKSIAVLPFKNNSQDSSNIYIINGLMDAILNNLQKVKDLKVISRTSAEKYRNSNLSISEIAEELGVSYFVEGSGQKINNQILLHVQLIDAQRDRQVWSEQYDRQITDIFKIQNEVASKIVNQVQAKITPEELMRMEEVPTTNIVAYDYFLKGLDLVYKGTRDDLLKSIDYFKKAIELDPEFARAYATLAITYYYIDVFRAQKEYGEEVNENAERAYLLDPQLSQSLIAKAFSYMNRAEYQTAVTYLEKALEIHPNSAFVLNFLSDFYANYIPNTTKYLEYSLKGLELDKAANDSTAISYLYLHVSNAFMQTGFSKQAIKYADKSLAYNSNNIYSMYVKAYAVFAMDKDVKKVNQQLQEIYYIDTTRIDVIQELAKTYYNLHDYNNAWVYYQKLLRIREEQNMSLFRHENIKIAFVCRELGYKEIENEMLEDYFEFASNDPSIYKDLLLSAYYAYLGDSNQSLQYLGEFSNNKEFQFWVLYLPNEPHMQSVVKLPEFQKIMKKLDKSFWDEHDRIQKELSLEGLL